MEGGGRGDSSRPSADPGAEEQLVPESGSQCTEEDLCGPEGVTSALEQLEELEKTLTSNQAKFGGAARWRSAASDMKGAVLVNQVESLVEAGMALLDSLAAGTRPWPDWTAALHLWNLRRRPTVPLESGRSLVHCGFLF